MLNNFEQIINNLVIILKNIKVKIEEVVEFLKTKNISIDIFRKNRKLSVFINSAMYFNIFAKRILESSKMLNPKENTKGLLEISSESIMIIKNLNDEFPDLIDEMLELRLLNKLDEKIEIKDDKLCLICMNQLDIDNNTNLFSYDFHILCINFWLNCVDNRSPFIL